MESDRNPAAIEPEDPTVPPIRIRMPLFSIPWNSLAGFLIGTRIRIPRKT